MLTSLLLLGAAESGWGAPRLLCTLDDKTINESSGLAPSLAVKGEWLTHNDSGDSARFYRFNEKGKVTGVFTLAGVSAFDWEDLATRRLGGKNWVYLGDIGDNARIRKSIVVHRVEEPRGKSGEVKVQATFEITYEDRARDCEAVMVAPNGDLWLVSKAREAETWAYVVRNPNKSGKYVAKKMGKLAVDTGEGFGGILVTGGDISPDGKRVLLRTYSGALEYKFKGSFDNWIKSEPTPIALRKEKQGEAIAYSLKGDRILTTSEGEPCPVTVIRAKKS